MYIFSGVTNNKTIKKIAPSSPPDPHKQVHLRCGPSSSEITWALLFCFFIPVVFVVSSVMLFFFFLSISESFLYRLSWRASVSARGSVRFCSVGRIECVFSSGPTGSAAAPAGKHLMETDFIYPKTNRQQAPSHPLPFYFYSFVSTAWLKMWSNQPLIQLPPPPLGSCPQM